MKKKIRWLQLVLRIITLFMMLRFLKKTSMERNLNGFLPIVFTGAQMVDGRSFGDGSCLFHASSRSGQSSPPNSARSSQIRHETTRYESRQK